LYGSVFGSSCPYTDSRQLDFYTVLQEGLVMFRRRKVHIDPELIAAISETVGGPEGARRALEEKLGPDLTTRLINGKAGDTALIREVVDKVIADVYNADINKEVDR
jgi:hypothetical protein